MRPARRRHALVPNSSGFALTDGRVGSALSGGSARLRTPARERKVMKPTDPSDLDALWNSAPPSGRAFDPASVAHLPTPVQRYLSHAIAPGTPLASAVRLRMHGAIKLKRWRPFKAEEVIVRDRGMIWRAHVKIGGMTIHGFDGFVDGAGAMRWQLCRLIPMLQASGPDITRSAADRFAAETIWLPSVFCGDEVSWNGDDPLVAHARFDVDGSAEDLALTLSQGSLQSVALPRWGNPDGGAFREIDFGAVVEQEATFDGYTIPARMRAGWYFGTDRFDTDGKFFHATIDDAVFR
jgi:hypothetical protein